MKLYEASLWTAKAFLITGVTSGYYAACDGLYHGNRLVQAFRNRMPAMRSYAERKLEELARPSDEWSFCVCGCGMLYGSSCSCGGEVVSQGSNATRLSAINEGLIGLESLRDAL